MSLLCKVGAMNLKVGGYFIEQRRLAINTKNAKIWKRGKEGGCMPPSVYSGAALALICSNLNRRTLVFTAPTIWNRLSDRHQRSVLLRLSESTHAGLFLGILNWGCMEKCLWGCKHMREAQIYISRDVVCQLGGGVFTPLPPRGGVKI